MSAMTISQNFKADNSPNFWNCKCHSFMRICGRDSLKAKVETYIFHTNTIKSACVLPLDNLSFTSYDNKH
jgi:hypothetical protein